VDVPFIAEPIQLSEQERTDLNEIAQSRSLPAGFVLRAKVILMLAEEKSFGVIGERLQTLAREISAHCLPNSFRLRSFHALLDTRPNASRYARFSGEKRLDFRWSDQLRM
jgi:hypothetical protein